MAPIYLISVSMNIGNVTVGPAAPVCVVAEIGANHAGRLDLAWRLIYEAKAAGADLVKFQCYTPDELTVDSDHPAFVMCEGPWKGRRLYDLYTEARTPFGWFPDLVATCEDAGVGWFASVFGADSLALMESLGCPAYKIASAEAADMELVRAIAATRKDVVLSDGMVGDQQLWECRRVLTLHAEDFMVLRCVSEYPSNPASYQLAGLRYDAARGLPVGISDHTLGNEVAIAAVALGACMAEKHLRLEDGAYMDQQPADYGHSVTPRAFASYVQAIRSTEAMLSNGTRKVSGSQWRRRLVFTRDLPRGHVIGDGDVRTARCGEGVLPDMLSAVIGRTVPADVVAGQPVQAA